MQNTQILDQIALQLNQIEVDGESMEYIIRKTGMDVQMLRQLIMKGNIHTIRHFLDERIELMNDEKRRIERDMSEQMDRMHTLRMKDLYPGIFL